MANVALIIASGDGSRMHQDITKQFLTVNEHPVIVYIIVCIEGWEQVLWAYAKQFSIGKLQYVIPGGKMGRIPSAVDNAFDFSCDYIIMPRATPSPRRFSKSLWKPCSVIF